MPAEIGLHCKISSLTLRCSVVAMSPVTGMKVLAEAWIWLEWYGSIKNRDAAIAPGSSTIKRLSCVPWTSFFIKSHVVIQPFQQLYYVTNPSFANFFDWLCTVNSCLATTITRIVAMSQVMIYRQAWIWTLCLATSMDAVKKRFLQLENYPSMYYKRFVCAPWTQLSSNSLVVILKHFNNHIVLQPLVSTCPILGINI